MRCSGAVLYHKKEFSYDKIKSRLRLFRARAVLQSNYLPFRELRILAELFLLNRNFGEISYSIKKLVLIVTRALNPYDIKCAKNQFAAFYSKPFLRTTSSSWLGYPMYSDRQVSRLIDWYTFLNTMFKNVSTKPIRIDFVDEAWLTLESLSHEIRNQCGFL